MILLGSCYHKEINYSFTTSYGGVVVGSSYYYLAQIREYKMPKGISRFPDGGMSKELRQQFGIYKTDSIDKSTMLVAQMNDVQGWPVRFSSRIEKNNELIAIGLKNINLADSVDGIYFLNLKNGKFERYNHEKALPSLSPLKSEIAYCIGNKLCIDDFETHTALFCYVLNSEPVFVTWKNESEILLYFSNPFNVKILDINDGKVRQTDLKYISNFGQELNATQINNLIRESKPDLKKILDKKK